MNPPESGYAAYDDDSAEAFEGTLMDGLEDEPPYPIAASLHEQAEQRVYTNDLDALEALIVEGLPPDEMQAAAWVLVQRVRGLQADLVRVEKARATWAARAAR